MTLYIHLSENVSECTVEVCEKYGYKLGQDSRAYYIPNVYDLSIHPDTSDCGGLKPFVHVGLLHEGDKSYFGRDNVDTDYLSFSMDQFSYCDLLYPKGVLD